MRIAELPKNDIDGDAGDEAGHHRVGHEAREEAQLERPARSMQPPTSSVSTMSACERASDG